MAVKTYSLKQHGRSFKLSVNFALGEFVCSDGSDIVKIDDALILLLQKIRDHFGKPVTINSAYRMVAHNKKVGGSPVSQHLLGTAADIAIQGIAWHSTRKAWALAALAIIPLGRATLLMWIPSFLPDGYREQ